MFVDDFLLALEDRVPIYLHVFHFESEFRGALEILIDFRVIEQHFGGDTPYMKARSADVAVLLHDERFKAILAGANCRDVTTRAAPDDDEIVLCQAWPP